MSAPYRFFGEVFLAVPLTLGAIARVDAWFSSLVAFVPASDEVRGAQGAVRLFGLASFYHGLAKYSVDRECRAKAVGKPRRKD